jgi:hypothetical protein
MESKNVRLGIRSSQSTSIPFEKSDTLTFSSAYFESLYTNAGLAVFGLELMRFCIRAEDYLEFESLWTKIGWNILAFFLLDECFGTAYHEIGHGLRARACGCDFQLLTDSESKSPFQKDENFFKFFLRELINTKRAACWSKWSLEEVDNKFFKESCIISVEGMDNKAFKERCIGAAGGMNNNVYFAEVISNNLYQRQHVHFLEGISYLVNHTYAVCYALIAKRLGDDPVTVSFYWEKLGVPADIKDMGITGVIALLLSGTTYRTLYATWNALSGNERESRPFSVYGFRVPDIFAYTTSKGMSYKLVSEYEVQDNLHILFGCEHVTYGHAATEMNVGVESNLGKSWHYLVCRGVLTFGHGMNMNVSVQLPILDRLLMTTGVDIYCRDSLLGERHAPNLNKEYSGTGYLSIALKY